MSVVDKHETKPQVTNLRQMRDITSLIVGFASGRGQMKKIDELTSIKGNELEAIIRGYSEGAEFVNVGINTYYLKIPGQ